MKPRECVDQHQEQRRRSDEPEHQPGVASHGVSSVDTELREPFVRNPGMPGGGMGKDLGGGDRVRGPDNLSQTHVPPQIRIAEAISCRECREGNQRGCEKDGKREDPSNKKRERTRVSYRPVERTHATLNSSPAAAATSSAPPRSSRCR